MPKRTIKRTLEEHGDAIGAPRGQPAASASYRREQAARTIERRYGNVLNEIARLAFESTDNATKLRALATLAPYLYPALKGVELSGPDGQSLTVEIRKVAPSPGLTPGSDSGKPEQAQ